MYVKDLLLYENIEFNAGKYIHVVMYQVKCGLVDNFGPVSFCGHFSLLFIANDHLRKIIYRRQSHQQEEEQLTHRKRKAFLMCQNTIQEKPSSEQHYDHQTLLFLGCFVHSTVCNLHFIILTKL